MRTTVRRTGPLGDEPAPAQAQAQVRSVGGLPGAATGTVERFRRRDSWS